MPTEDDNDLAKALVTLRWRDILVPLVLALVVIVVTVLMRSF